MPKTFTRLSIVMGYLRNRRSRWTELETRSFHHIITESYLSLFKTFDKIDFPSTSQTILSLRKLSIVDTQTSLLTVSNGIVVPLYQGQSYLASSSCFLSTWTLETITHWRSSVLYSNAPLRRPGSARLFQSIHVDASLLGSIYFNFHVV